MESKVSQLINHLAFNFLKVLSGKENGNIYYSPFNLFIILNSIAMGAKESTQKQIAVALNMSEYFENIADMFEAATQVLQTVLREDRLNSLLFANKILIQRKNNLSLNSDFEDAIKSKFATNIEQIDFCKEHIVDDINSWLSQVTFKNIKSIVNKVDANSNTVLLNAAYFHGMWNTKFEENETEYKAFYNESGAKEIPFMFVRNVTCKLYILVFEDEDVEILELPFVGSITMNIVLPRSSDAMKYLYNAIDYLTIEEYKDSEATKVNVWLPRFEIEAKYELRDALEHIGITDAFGNSCDFGNIREDKGVHLSRVVHKSCIKVDEQGKELSERCDQTFSFSIFKCLPKYVRTLHVDRPFIFYIQDMWTRVILFIGEIKEL